jgi:hypothetical protein|nr:MAG TPA: hypothetical protein [Caudoviricetes sp.]
MSNWKGTKCGKCKIQRAKPICNTCEGYNKFVPMTNADCIRSMSDEELAKFLQRFGTFNQPCSLAVGEPLKWLQSEVEE